MSSTSVVLEAAQKKSLLGKENGLDVWQNSSLGDGHTGKQLVQLLVVADSELQMARVDSALLVVTSSVTGQLEHLSGEVFEHSSQVHRCSSSDASSIVSLAEHAVKTTNWELESSTRRTRLRLSSALGFASLSTSRHDGDRELRDVHSRVAEERSLHLYRRRLTARPYASRRRGMLPSVFIRARDREPRLTH
ncbi:hypothetical protein NECAME_00150 [Necator americanus]|uniref:Uncharacterized protein n=1 Tax=Necator americanus TaxID=51031 RepID=W2U1Q2_NECAM|nr:hypothetical protein NECAME_00150 [Necator americanus]ETN87291.1 hypothetical protein NECAME_00150 [Necator americanus]